MVPCQLYSRFRKSLLPMQRPGNSRISLASHDYFWQQKKRRIWVKSQDCQVQSVYTFFREILQPFGSITESYNVWAFHEEVEHFNGRGWASECGAWWSSPFRIFLHLEVLFQMRSLRVQLQVSASTMVSDKNQIITRQTIRWEPLNQLSYGRSLLITHASKSRIVRQHGITLRLESDSIITDCNSILAQWHGSASAKFRRLISLAVVDRDFNGVHPKHFRIQDRMATSSQASYSAYYSYPMMRHSSRAAAI